MLPMTTIPKRSAPYPARVPDLIERWSVAAFWWVAAAGGAVVAVLLGSRHVAAGLVAGVVLAVYVAAGLIDIRQTRHAVRRNFPVLGRLRYVLEGLRPEVRQYFFEDEDEDNPISRERRGLVYARAKAQVETLPFGTRHDIYRDGYEWIHHSLSAVEPASEEKRIPIGEAAGLGRPYRASVLNVSAMSFGSLSRNAVLALNEGARRGGFAHNTGEGGVSPYHLEPGGDLVWQIGTGYFGCRSRDGGFDPGAFRERMEHDAIRMVEVKLSQGAKPGHGGILPGKKVTSEIARIRGVEPGKDVLSPPTHRAFSNPVGLLEFLQRLRELSGGRPVGFKLCLGGRVEFMGIVKAMHDTGIVPDFIAVDGAEGGTGAAPLEFSNSVGTPLVDGLSFVHRALVGAGVRERTRLFAAGKVTTGFDILRLLALGADAVYSARAMMFAVGCIQALKCNTNHCPVGVATQDERLVRGLVVEDKAERVYRFHRRTVEAAYELLAAAGLKDPSELRPGHIRRRSDRRVWTYAELYPVPAPDSLRFGSGPEELQRFWDAADSRSF